MSPLACIAVVLAVATLGAMICIVSALDEIAAAFKAQASKDSFVELTTNVEQPFMVRKSDVLIVNVSEDGMGSCVQLYDGEWYYVNGSPAEVVAKLK